MKRIETHYGFNLLARQRLVHRAVRAVVSGILLLVAMPGAAQENSRKGDGMSQQQTDKPNPELKSLNILIGAWNVSDPSGKGTISGTESYEWMEGGFFLMHRFDFQHYGHKVKGIEIIGYEHPFGAEPGKDIKSRVYDTRGNTLDYVWEVNNETLTIWGGQKGSPAYFKGKFSDNGDTCTGAWVYPGGGGYDAKMTRVKK